jgi:hypothetical protein
MKKQFAFVRAHRLASLYALAAVLTVLGCLFAALWDAAGYATGRLHTETVPFSSLTAQDIVCSGSGVWVSSGDDPQLLLTADQTVRTVRWETPADPTAAEGYYGRAGSFSLRRRVFGQAAEKGGALLVFPLPGGSTVRIDPAASAGVVLAQGADAVLYLNEPQPLWRYFALRPQQWFWLLVIPAALAAVWDQGSAVGRALKKTA